MNCEINIDDCISINCNGQGQCMDGNSSHVCLCDAGFTGQNCAVNIEDCMNNSYSGHGQCIDGVNSFSCECDFGYTGEQCDSVMVLLDGCSNFQCVNGSCSLSENSELVCNCDPGYTGEQCYINIDDCFGVDCGNNYHCVDGVNSYECVCDFENTEGSCELSTEGKHSKQILRP